MTQITSGSRSFLEPSPLSATGVTRSRDIRHTNGLRSQIGAERVPSDNASYRRAGHAVTGVQVVWLGFMATGIAVEVFLPVTLPGSCHGISRDLGN
jgi:hypothetical protein